MPLLSSNSPPVWRFGSFELNQETGELRKSGAEVRLPLQPARILGLLVAHAGKLVTREEIRHQIWGEAAVDFDAGLNFCLNRIRVALEDNVNSPSYIETLPRRGYRFIAPVEPVLTSPPLLAVLPFDNLSRHPEQDLIADAVSDALITELGGLNALRVISRQTVLHFKGSQKTIPEIGRELQADAIVEGAVWRDGNRIRITAQLIQSPPSNTSGRRGTTAIWPASLLSRGRLRRKSPERSNLPSLRASWLGSRDAGLSTWKRISRT